MEVDLVGQAGGRIVETIVEEADRTGDDIAADATVVDTAKADLLGLDTIPLGARSHRAVPRE